MAILWFKRIVNDSPVRVLVQPNDSKNPLLHEGNWIKFSHWTGASHFKGTFSFTAGDRFWLEPGGYVVVDDFAIPWSPHWLRFSGDAVLDGQNKEYTNENHIVTLMCAPGSDGQDHIHFSTKAHKELFRLGPTGPLHQLVGELVIGPQGHMKPWPGTQGDQEIWNGLNHFAHRLWTAIELSTKPEKVSALPIPKQN